MAIVYVQQKKVQRNLILVFLGILLIIGLIVWWGFFREEKNQSQEKIITSPHEEIKINFEVFQSPFLKALQPFSAIQPLQGSAATTTNNEKIGRENPFLPY